jgi:hypothetical protein
MTEPMSYRSSLMWTGQVLRQWGSWTRSHWRTTLLLSAAAFVVGWVWNMYVMAVDGGSTVDSDTASTAEGHTANILYWLLLFSLLAGLISYGWSRGWRNAGSDLLTLPRRFSEAIAHGPAPAFGMLFWGLGVSLIISTLISSAVSMVLGLLLLTLAATPVGVVLNFAVIRVWRGLCGIVAPTGEARLGGVVSPFMVMVGEAVGLLIAWMVSGWVFGLIAGMVCVVVSVLLVRAAPPPRMALLLLFMAGAVTAIQAWRIGYAYADDGGWSECSCGIFDWFSSPGADVVIQRSTVGGVGAALGALLGAGVGAGAAGLASASAQANLAGQSGSGTSQRQDLSPAADVGHDSAQTIDHDVADTAVDLSGSGQPGTGDTTIPHQQAWPDISQQPDQAASAPADAAHLESSIHYDAPSGGHDVPSGGHDAPSGGPGQTDGSGGTPPGSAGPAGGSSSLDIQDLLPEEPDREEDDDSGDTHPPAQR